MYSAAVCLRFIAARMRSDPDCTGKCRNGISCGNLGVSRNQIVAHVARMAGHVAEPLEPIDAGKVPDQVREARRRPPAPSP